jgi:hypothetical protein
MEEGEVRKTRSDKKRDVRPTLTPALNECIHDLSYVLNRPLKDIGEWFVIGAISSRSAIESLSMYFTREYHFNNTIFCGSLEAPNVHKRNKIPKTRITLRLKGPDHEKVSALAYSMDCSVSMATTLLLDAGIRDQALFNRIVDTEIVRMLDPERLNRLRMIQRYINRSNDSRISLFSLVSYVVHEVVDTTKTMSEKVSDWIDDNVKKI